MVQNKNSVVKEKLNLGCGQDIKPDFVNLDVVNLKGVDVVHNLDKLPYPFKDNSFKIVYCDNVLEHLFSKVLVLEELWRITKDGGRIIIKVPIYPSHLAFTDPTHKQFFTYETFDYFKPEHSFHYYSKAKFIILRKRLIFWRWKKWMGYLLNWSEMLKKFYTRNLSFIMSPDLMYIELRVVKNRRN